MSLNVIKSQWSDVRQLTEQGRVKGEQRESWLNNSDTEVDTENSPKPLDLTHH